MRVIPLSLVISLAISVTLLTGCASNVVPVSNEKQAWLYVKDSGVMADFDPNTLYYCEKTTADAVCTKALIKD